MLDEKKKVAVLILVALLLLTSTYLFYRFLIGTKDQAKRHSDQKANTAIMKELDLDFVYEGEHDLPDGRGEKDIDYLALSQQYLTELNKRYETDKIIAFLDTGKDGIKEIIAFDPDSNFYDRKDIKGNYDHSGTVFLYKENEGLNDQYLNFFGHSMKDGSRLKKLLDYKKYQDRIQHARLYTSEGIYIYELTKIIEMHSQPYDKYKTWEEADFMKFVGNVLGEGKIVLDKSPINDEASYMLLNTCTDDTGIYRTIAIYELVDVKS